MTARREQKDWRPTVALASLLEKSIRPSESRGGANAELAREGGHAARRGDLCDV